jgi:hypothetical protein
VPGNFDGFATKQATAYAKMALSDKLRDVNGVLIGFNDNWGQASNAFDITATGLAPTTNSESAILTTLGPGRYSSAVRGANNSTGIGLAEVYKLDN